MEYADGDTRRGVGHRRTKAGALSLQPHAVYVVPEATARAYRRDRQDRPMAAIDRLPTLLITIIAMTKGVSAHPGLVGG